MAKFSPRLSFILPLFGFAVLLVISGIALFSTLSGTRDITQLPSVLIGKPHRRPNWRCCLRLQNFGFSPFR